MNELKVKTFLWITFSLLFLALTGMSLTQCAMIYLLNPFCGILAFIFMECVTSGGILLGYLVVKKDRNLEEEL